MGHVTAARRARAVEHRTVHGLVGVDLLICRGMSARIAARKPYSLV